MNFKYFLLIVLIFSFVFTNLRTQDIPQRIYFQGNLADASGKPINGYKSMKFCIWSNQTGGSKLWEETHHLIDINNGLFSVVLGSRNPISVEVFSNKTRYLEIVISGEALKPRQQITSVPYAHTTASVSGASNVFPSEGNVGIGITNPQAKLHIKNEGENALQLPLRLVNPDGTDAGGTATGILFETEAFGFGKGALVYERTSNYGNGSFHFLQNTLNDNSNPTLDNAVVTINNNGNVEIDGSIHSTTGGFKFPDGSVQVSAASGKADNLGNHTATQNLKMNGHLLLNSGISNDQDLNVQTGKDLNIQTGNRMVISLGTDLIINVGDNTTFECSDMITFKCGKASIIMKKNGDILIKGGKVTIDGSTDVIIHDPHI